MKRLLFVIPEYSHGGTNKSLENLLSLIDKTKYQISVYCFYEDGGEFYKKAFAPYILKKSWLYYWMHDNVWTRKVMGLYNKLTTKDNFAWLYKREVRHLQRHHDFDTVIAYQEGTATVFVSYFTNVKKVAWIHCDYGNRARGIRIAEGEIYEDFDHVVCVSQAARQSFCTLYPEMENKTHAIYNVVRVDGNDNPNLNLNGNKNDFVIVSVGRLNPVKQFEKIPAIVNEVKKSVHRSYRWYIIGSGASEATIREEIVKYGLQDVVVLLGPKDNPYPYMKQADIVVSTSESESFSYVIAEAKVLHTPVLSNDYPVAYEVVDDFTGWIANIKDMPQVLARIIDNVDGEYDRKKASVMKYEYSNHEIIQRIDELFENDIL